MKTLLAATGFSASAVAEADFSYINAIIIMAVIIISIITGAEIA